MSVQLTDEEEQVILYANARIAKYKERAAKGGPYAAEYGISMQTLTVLIGDLRAGLHHPEETVDG